MQSCTDIHREYHEDYKYALASGLLLLAAAASAEVIECTVTKVSPSSRNISPGDKFNLILNCNPLFLNVSI